MGQISCRVMPMMALAMGLLGCGDQRAPAEPTVDAVTVDSMLVDANLDCPPGLATCVGDVCTIAPELADEAIMQLGRIETLLRAAYARDGHFPIQTASATPASTCCAAGCVPICPANPGAWSGAAWMELGFSIETAHVFVYSYGCTDGVRVYVSAIADLDCDTVVTGFVLTCTAPGGVPECILTRPMALD